MALVACSYHLGSAGSSVNLLTIPAMGSCVCSGGRPFFLFFCLSNRLAAHLLSCKAGPLKGVMPLYAVSMEPALESMVTRKLHLTSCLKLFLNLFAFIFCISVSPAGKPV